MNFFTDTNIPIGYTVIHDKWHIPAKKFINNHSNDSIFWSNLVHEEYNKTLNEIIDDVNVFLYYCKSSLETNQKDFINYFDFENYLLKKTNNCQLDSYKKQKIFEEFWNNYHFTEGIAELVYLKFIDFTDAFEKIYFDRRKKLKKIMKLHNCSINNYKRYRSYADKLNEWRVHSPDCKIVTDAHDCGLQHKNLTFVSTDSEMIDIILEHNHSFLSIVEFKSYNYSFSRKVYTI